MASIYNIKPAFQNLLRPITRSLAARGVTANQVTVGALLLSLTTGLTLVLRHQQTGLFLLVPLVMFIRMALNAIDGMLAREHDMKSPLGAILNELCDVISDAALYLPFALLPGVLGWIVVLFVLAAVISEMTGVVAVQIGASRRYDGPMGKSDRAFVFGVIALTLGLGLPSASWMNELFGVILLLTLATSYNRASKALAEIKA
jgi:CDP-diacylglycerol---glycerol-3-phosphate 3-phosphatidyltransferase